MALSKSFSEMYVLFGCIEKLLYSLKLLRITFFFLLKQPRLFPTSRDYKIYRSLKQYVDHFTVVDDVKLKQIGVVFKVYFAYLAIISAISLVCLSIRSKRKRKPISPKLFVEMERHRRARYFVPTKVRNTKLAQVALCHRCQTPSVLARRRIRLEGFDYST